MTSITYDEIQKLTAYIYSISGISLDQSKAYLLETRLRPLLLNFGLNSFHQLYQEAQSKNIPELDKKIIDSISTQETMFFRDKVPFDLLKHKLLPDMIDFKAQFTYTGNPKIKIWSTACSSGQEVYSIAIAIKEVLPSISNYDLYILGTDISEEAIARASYGTYNEFEINRGLSPELRKKYFQQNGDKWRIKDEIRAMVNFKKMNLMHDFSALGKFDMIFCRNVAIYFSQNGKQKLFQRVAAALEPHGYLLLGGSESLTGIAPQFVTKRYLNGIYYQLQSKRPTHPPKPSSATKTPLKENTANIKQSAVKPEKKAPRPQKREPASPKKIESPTDAPYSTPKPQPKESKKDKGKSSLIQRLNKQGAQKKNTSLLNSAVKKISSQMSLMDKLNKKKNQKNE